ncbi:MAG: type II toxin-antitoxin system VapC family toxin [Candidatus Dormibacteraeota bacterium]|nr:type II toxin-antitoxin system VapC family toxin [Candidatus Dormibacteraeota bacterium]
MENVTCVLDASALLAYLNDEAGAQLVEDALFRGSAISAVNMAEVLTKLTEIGEEPDKVSEELQRRGLLGGKLAVLPLTADDAVVLASLHGSTKMHGLSLGDRACLGLAHRLRVPALTADRAWARLKVAVKIEPIR